MMWPTQDKHAWNAATKVGKLFEGSGTAATWRSTTLNRAKYAYAAWLQHLMDTEPGVLAKCSPTIRISPQRVAAHAEAMRERMSMAGVAAALGHLLLAARAVGPAEDWTWLRDLHNRRLTLGKAA